jgi:hypothetical protein
VGRSKDVALVSRNRDIIRMIGEGYSYQVIADQFGVTKQRIAQVNKEYQEDIPDDDYRDWQRTELEGMKDELLRIFRLPGKLMVTPGGAIICEYGEDGKPDKSKPVYDPYAKTEVAITVLKVWERLAKAYGLDRMRQREKDSSSEITEALSFLEQQSRQAKILAAQNAALRKQIEDHDIIEADVVEETPGAPATGEQAPDPYS